MLSRRSCAAVAASAASALLLVGMLVGSPAAADVWDPDDPCEVDSTAVGCEDHPGSGEGGGDPVCIHLGVEVPCIHPSGLGWWTGDVRLGSGWSYVVIDGDFHGVDEPLQTGDTRGCWARLDRRTGGDTGIDSPGDDPLVEGGWYFLACLGGQTWPVDDLLDLHGALGEIQAWRAISESPAASPEVLALQARAELSITSPTVRISPPETGSLLLGMPVWLAIEEDGPGWGPLSNTVCDGPLCVSITAEVTSVEWRMGDGHTEVCTREQNMPWQRGVHDPLRPGDYCTYYYSSPSRHLDGGRYRIEVVAHWETYWEAPSLGLLSQGPLTHIQEATATVRVNEAQVLVGPGA